MATRPAAKAGLWYLKNPVALEDQLKSFLADVPESIDGAALPIRGARVVIAPHAGYDYSGPCAAWAYKCLDLTGVKRIFVLGPSHTYYLEGCAVSQFGKYATPLGDLIVDRDTVQQVQDAAEMDVILPKSDSDEHSLEMHMPYLYLRCKETFGSPANFPKIVPLLIGDNSRNKEKAVGRALLPYIKDPENAFVVSSDFCHWGKHFSYMVYSPTLDAAKLTKLRPGSARPNGPPIHDTIELIDELAMEAVKSGSHDAFLDSLKLTRNTVCGRHPIGVMLAALEQLRTEQAYLGRGRFTITQYQRSEMVESTSQSSVSYVSAYAVVYGNQTPYDQRDTSSDGYGNPGGYNQAPPAYGGNGGYHQSPPAQGNYGGENATLLGPEGGLGLHSDHDLGSNVEMAPLAHNAGSFAHGDPNAILNECRDIDRGVDDVEQNLEQVRMLQQQTLNDADSSSNSATNRKLDVLTTETMALYRELTERVRMVKSNPESRTPKNSPQVGRVDRRLKQAIQQYQQVESQFRKRTQDQMARQYRIVRPDASEDEVRQAVEDTTGGQVFSQALMQSDRQGRAHAALSAVKDRHAALVKIEQQMVELAQLFQDMDTLVIQQEAAVTQIEAKGEEVVENLDKGNVEIGVAVGISRKTRKKKWICLGICVAIIAIIVIIVLIYIFVVKGKKDDNKKRSVIDEIASLPFVNTIPDRLKNGRRDLGASIRMSRIARERIHLPQMAQ
ncbi:hypothetical protein G7046_g2295 [Stylonectria norvegica]|nr:hypothetical protein G7046_g2295 [Stylonectria norvegica]